jgi:hypothetical protein
MVLGFSTQPSLKTFRLVQPWQPVKTGQLGKSRTRVTPGVSPVSTTKHDPRGCASNTVVHSPCQNGASFADERPAAIVNRPPCPPRKGLGPLNVARVLAARNQALRGPTSRASITTRTARPTSWRGSFGCLRPKPIPRTPRSWATPQASSPCAIRSMDVDRARRPLGGRQEAVPVDGDQ